MPSRRTAPTIWPALIDVDSPKSIELPEGAFAVAAAWVLTIEFACPIGRGNRFGLRGRGFGLGRVSGGAPC